jgi:hypothetical protein
MIKDVVIKFPALVSTVLTILFAYHSPVSANTVTDEILGYYSNNYHESRSKFLDAAHSSGGRIYSYQNPIKGPDNEALYIDVACFGASDPKTILVLGSGTHGVEGFAGSAMQTGLLKHGIVSTLAPHVGLVIIHAINPYGIAYLRRVNEENIDLNRNFLDHSKAHPSNEGYDELADWITPKALSLWNDATLLVRLLWYKLYYDTTKLRFAISGGQYTQPNGLFYGGLAPTWSNKTIRKIANHHLYKAKRVMIIDYHTGLGSYGKAELIMNVRKESLAYQRAKQWWGDLVTSTVTGGSVSADLRGTLKLAFEEMLPDSEVTAVSMEFETLSRKEVFLALRSENWLHHHAGSEHPNREQIKNDLLQAFYPDDKEWKLDVWRQSREIVEKVIDQLQ